MSSSWVDIQQKAFTRWCNEHLKKRGMHIDDLKKDLCDGVLLCNLLEVISDKRIRRFNKNPRVPFQKLENCGIALEFIKNEGIKLVNIGASDIADGNLKLILGLIWILILRWQIQGIGDGGVLNAKNELLEWVRSKIPEYDVKNFTKDWNDGRAICGLVNALQPGLCPEHFSLNPNDKLANATKGIDMGYDLLGVPKIVQPEEMIHPRLDEHANMTYISYYRDLEARGVPKRDEAALCRAYGDGLVEGVVDEPSEFMVETPDLFTGKLEVKVFGPHDPAPVIVSKDSNNNYQMSYTPTEPGLYHVHVTVDGKHIPGSVFEVNILERESLGGEGKVRVFYSTTTSSRKITRPLQELFEKKGSHLREDFEVDDVVFCYDIMDKDDREAVFRVAGTRTLPIVYIDDKYAGSTDEIFVLEKSGELDKMLNASKKRFDQLYCGGQQSVPAASAHPAAAAGSSTESRPPKFCGNCGTKFTAAEKFCGSCGAKV